MKRVLAIDVGGTTGKFRVQCGPSNSFPSNRELSAAEMCGRVLSIVSEDEFDAVTIGFPGPTGETGPCAEPELIGSGWVGFDFTTRFNRPVKVVNDAAMQALGCYRGGRMLFLGLGTGLGTCVISNYLVISLEVANLPYKHGQSYGDFLAQRGLNKYGEEEWKKSIWDVVRLFGAAFVVKDIVFGGGNSNRLGVLPPHTRRADNSVALDGGILLWDEKCKFAFG